MRSGSDLTAAAVIRDTAMRLFARRGAAAVTVRDIAAAAGVSPALVIHHYKSKDGLKAAVDERAVQSLIELAGEFADPSADVQQTTSMAASFAERLDAYPDLLDYLRRLLVEGGAPAQELFARLYELTITSLAASEAAGVLRPTRDAEARAAFLLVNDLGVVLLREQITTVLGVDPLGRPGIVRWTEQLVDAYAHGIFDHAKDSRA